ncbi:DUF4267 domain-containing protein [Kribbella qitaiheensis]|uniref:DUF4267 domain-containing protein n=1 Tax=Kribbella qitaiheensis TaxID=1544730 RepID=UPI0019D65496|nr:DUF4267 domain-containing protein [Kribbella qitaiheensis]
MPVSGVLRSAPIKGIRDVVLALVLGILLATGHRRALGWVLLVEAFAAYGDMTTVLAHHGSVATALGVHARERFGDWNSAPAVSG